jgi:hypothetical protein
MVIITTEVLAPLDAYVDAVRANLAPTPLLEVRLALLRAIETQTQNPETLVYDPGPEPSPVQRAVADLVRLTARAAIRDASPLAIQSAAERVVALAEPAPAPDVLALAIQDFGMACRFGNSDVAAVAEEKLSRLIDVTLAVAGSMAADLALEAHIAVIRILLTAPLPVLARVGAHAYQYPSWRARYSLEANADDPGRGAQYAPDFVLEFAAMAQGVVSSLAKSLGYDRALWEDVPNAETLDPPDGLTYEAIRAGILVAQGSQEPFIEVPAPTEA